MGSMSTCFALKYGRSAQHHADNCFYEVVKPKHKNVKRRDFCLPACPELKCLSSINFTSQICMKIFHYLEIKKTWLSANKINTIQSVLCKWVLQKWCVAEIWQEMNKWAARYQDRFLFWHFSHIFLFALCV